MVSENTALVPLQAAVQNYAWGLPPTEDSLVARIHALNATKPVDPSQPYAELWIGVHPSGPARLIDDVDATLADLLAANSLPSLPYLLKILSVAKPLSIQAHPDKRLAGVLHANNPKAYKDDNHKPEMCVALTAFEGMCNFRPVSEIIAHLTELTPLRDLCGGEEALSALSAATISAQKRAALRTVFSELMNAPQAAVAEALAAVSDHVACKQMNSPADWLFQRLCNHYPGDVGCFSAYLLNFVSIMPGQAFFMSANEPHAYLKGQCVEIMANSDNVVRAGLTPKFKDVPNLVNMLTYNDKPPTIMTGTSVDDYTTVYQPPADEFQLARVVVPAGFLHSLPPAAGPGLIMCLDGTGWITTAGTSDENAASTAKRMPLAPGKIYYVRDRQGLTVQADKPAVPGTNPPSLFLFRAGVNERQ